MTERKNDGWSAFPVPDGGDWGRHGGMSLRDYFAAQALDRLDMDVIDRIAGTDAPACDEIGDDNRYVVPPTEIARRIATAAYLIADAMLEARDR